MRHIFLAFLLAVAACCGSGMDDPVGRDATGRGTACSVARGGRRRSRRRCALSFSGRAGARRLPDVPGGQRLEPRRLLGPDRDACLLYETYDTHWNGSGYDAGSGAVFDLRTGALRKDGWTSATASGLPILPGLVRYDEVVEQKEIRHALTFTAARAARAWVHPATHYGNSDDPDAPPMGARVRLKASFDLSRFTGSSRVILPALQRYGMFLVDEAGDGFVAISGATDSRWDDHDLDQAEDGAVQRLRGGPAPARAPSLNASQRPRCEMHSAALSAVTGVSD